MDTTRKKMIEFKSHHKIFTRTKNNAFEQNLEDVSEKNKENLAFFVFALSGFGAVCQKVDFFVHAYFSVYASTSLSIG